jgi:hypothetical protein
MRIKLLTLFCLVLLTVCSIALAGSSFFAITLSHENSAADNADAFESWYDAAEWTSAERAVWAATFARLSGESQLSGELVYVASNSGSKYHRDPGCSYLKSATRVSDMTLPEALEHGYTPCSKCGD